MIEGTEEEIQEVMKRYGWSRKKVLERFALFNEYASNLTPVGADALPCGHSMGTVESENYIVCSVCGRHVRRSTS